MFFDKAFLKINIITSGIKLVILFGVIVCKVARESEKACHDQKVEFTEDFGT